MLYDQSLVGCFTKNFLTENEFNEIIDLITPIKEELSNKRNTLPLLFLPEQKNDIKAINSVAELIREKFKKVIVIGIGGSCLNGKSITNLLNFKSQDINISFIDNIDPHSIDLLIKDIIPKQTAVICISKSGKTPETISQLLVLIEKYRNTVTDPLKDFFFFITDPNQNPLRNIAKKIDAHILDHPAVGGRFSTFTSVGLLPAVVIGLNPDKICYGATRILNQFFNQKDSIVAQGAAMQIAWLKKGLNINVFMPYIDRLSTFADWVCQIYAESLGKNNIGINPIKAIGAIDQHSLLQLFLDGPNDKFFTIFTLDVKSQGPSISNNLTEDNDISYLNNKTIGDVMAAEQEATIQTLINNNRPVRVVSLKELNEEVIGALMMQFTLEVIILAHYLNVDPFDQPSVEQGKLLTKEILSR